jgi:phosphoribosyl 1,2-cyclic phosphate phosphodiesterase
VAEIVFLGTAAALRLPSFHCSCVTCEQARRGEIPPRTRSSLAILGGETTIIDAGPDIAEQMERESIRRVHHILLSHWHYDHVGGLTEFGEPSSIEKWDPIALFTPRSGIDHFEAELQYLKPRFSLHRIDPGVPFEVDSLRVLPVKTRHTEDSVGFIIDGDRRVAYLSDGIRPPEDSMSLLRDVDELILEATLDELDEANWFNLDVAGAIEIWEEIGSPACVLTHMSFHSWRDGSLVPGFDATQRDEVIRRHPGLRMAHDGMRIQV